MLEDRHGEDLFAYLQAMPDGVLALTVFWTSPCSWPPERDPLPAGDTRIYTPAIFYIRLQTGLAQISDFGLSSLLSREQPTLQPPERIEGVLAYISPEQTGRMNRALDYPLRLYTLGCTFYHLLSGHPPFQAGDALGLVHAHIAKQQTPLHHVRDEVPPALSAIIDRLMNKTAEDRYQSALGLKKDPGKVRNALAQNKPVPDFPLGMEDISDRLQIPQKLYGREKEVERLLQGFFQAAGANLACWPSPGIPGIGNRPWCTRCINPSPPTAAFSVRANLTSSRKTSLIQYANGTQGLDTEHPVVAGSQTAGHENAAPRRPGKQRAGHDRLYAGLRLGLGELPAVAQLGADETQNRFHLVFQRFIKEITREHPGVVY